MKKVILITGGTSGIGLACAEYLIKNNYEVIITGRSQTNLNNALAHLNHQAVGLLSDTSKLTDIDQLAQFVKEKYTQIDGLFLNAGIFHSASFEDTDEALFDQTMNINFKGAFFTTQKFIPLLKNPSSVVFNTSIVVFKAFANTAAYTASKAALESIAKVLNTELSDKGIRFNIVSPGVTQSPIQQKSGMSEQAIENLLSHFATTSPIGRIVQPQDIAPIVEFLMSDRSSVLRNEKIIIDGGTTM